MQAERSAATARGAYASKTPNADDFPLSLVSRSKRYQHTIIAASARGSTFMVAQQEFKIETHGHGHMQDVTEQVARIVANCGIKTGTAHVFNIGSTAALGTIEFE